MTAYSARAIVLLCLAFVQTALLLHVPAGPLRAPRAASRAASPLLCAAEGEAPAEEAAAADPKAAEKAEKAALREAIAALEAKLPKARGELVEAQDAAKDAGENGYMLLAANFERFRQQARGELDSQKGYGRVAAVRSLLPFAEAFEGLQEGAAADGEDGAPIHKYYGGIYKQLQQLLDSWQVSPYNAEASTPFDRTVHQTVESVASDDVPANTIIEPVERGWKMGGEVVRLAKVTVSTGPAVEEPPAEEAAEGDAAAADDAAAE